MKESKLNSRNDAGGGRVLGVAWYSEAEWAKLKRVAADPEALDDTYEEWRRGHADLVKNLHESGEDHVSVTVLIDEVSDWCAKEGRPLDGAARAEFVARRLRRNMGASGGA